MHSNKPRSKLRFSHLLGVVLFSSTTIYFWTNRAPQIELSSLSYCPITTSRSHVPTVILVADGKSSRNDNRTFWFKNEAGGKIISFLPFSYPPREMRFAQRISTDSTNHKLEHHNSEFDEGKRLCSIFSIPTSPTIKIPISWNNNKIMFGMSTLPDRVLNNLLVWQHWLPTLVNTFPPSPIDSTTTLKNDLPLVLVLSPPPNPTEAARLREALEEAQSLGMNVKIRPFEASRFETRYFALVKEMWSEAQIREKATGIVTEWFVFADDDTFFPDFDALVRMVTTYDSAKDNLIGTLSESTKQVGEWGHIAYGGAGIYVSRALVAKMNSGEMWQECLDKFGSAFGGDAMISQCAALALSTTVPELLTIEPTLHQLDIRGDSTGWFQSGFLITSLHHWGSWFTIFPPWIESGNGDQRKGISLVGKASKGVGGDNWGRRYVFDDGKVVVHLGYSISITAKAVTESELGQSEHTWNDFDTFHPMRTLVEEGLGKRTYYLVGVRTLDSGVIRLEHKNREGERVDVIMDNRIGSN